MGHVPLKGSILSVMSLLGLFSKPFVVVKSFVLDLSQVDYQLGTSCMHNNKLQQDILTKIAR